MRLEPFCKISMRYADSSWHRPYGRGEAAEAIGFGQGEGIVSGEVQGAVTWANYPRRRQDGAWTPNLRGVIRTADGDELLLSIHGRVSRSGRLPLAAPFSPGSS
jgi:hypothetical protein